MTLVHLYPFYLSFAHPPRELSGYLRIAPTKGGFFLLSIFFLPALPRFLDSLTLWALATVFGSVSLFMVLCNRNSVSHWTREVLASISHWTPLPTGYIALVVLIPNLSAYHIITSTDTFPSSIWFFPAILCLFQSAIGVTLFLYETVNYGCLSWAWPSFIVPVVSMSMITIPASFRNDADFVLPISHIVFASGYLVHSFIHFFFVVLQQPSTGFARFWF
eukprot:Phypoly_transcript_17515.p1 GENE.Phypoly_transcript_17515~~Phypoly_transcript_17515.p1  ORF type:complete len:244 (+),score=14.86 Phypoly_transcript_17515:78-734(+)